MSRICDACNGACVVWGSRCFSCGGTGYVSSPGFYEMLCPTCGTKVTYWRLEDGGFLAECESCDSILIRNGWT